MASMSGTTRPGQTGEPPVSPDDVRYRPAAFAKARAENIEEAILELS